VAEIPVMLISRHGETELNIESVLKGYLDASLTEKGLSQAEKQAEILSQFPITKVFCSPLLRAFQSASFTANVLGLEPIQDRRLATWHVGIFAGVSKKDAKLAIQLFLDNPGVPMPDGQSIEQFEEQVADFFTEKLPQAEQDGPYAVFTHNSDISALANMLTGNRTEVVELSDVIPTGGIVGLYPNGESYRLEALFIPKQEETPNNV